MDNLEKKANALRGMAENFGKEFSEELMEMWLKLLADYDLAQVQKACLIVLTEYEFKTIPPFAVLKKALDKVCGKVEPEIEQKTTAESEWAKLIKDVAKRGYTQGKPENMHQTTEYVLQKMGGWDTARMWNPAHYDFKRKEFIEMWIRVHENGEALGLPVNSHSIEQGSQSAGDILADMLPQKPRQVQLCS